MFIINGELARCALQVFKENRYLPKVSIEFAIHPQSVGNVFVIPLFGAIVRSLKTKKIEESTGKPREKARFYGKNPINPLPFEFVPPFDPFPYDSTDPRVLPERINSRRKMIRRINPSSGKFSQ